MLPKHTRYERFVILCTARTGSTWLHTLLNSSLFIHSKGEIVRENAEGEQHPFERIAFGPSPTFIKAVGLKVFYDSPIYQEALQYLFENSDVKVILLSRLSALEQFVSYKKATASGQWSHSKDASPNHLEVDVKEFSIFKQAAKKDLEKVLKQLKNHEVFSLTYEDLLVEQTKILEKLQLFLEAPPQRLQSLLQKQSVIPISQQVANWEQIKNHL